MFKAEKNLNETDYDTALRKVAAALVCGHDGNLLIKESCFMSISKKKIAVFNQYLRTVFGPEASISVRLGGNYLLIPASNKAREGLDAVYAEKAKDHNDEILKGIRVIVESPLQSSRFVRKKAVTDEVFNLALDYLRQKDLEADGTFCYPVRVNNEQKKIIFNLIKRQVENNPAERDKIINELSEHNAARFGETKVVGNEYPYFPVDLYNLLGANFDVREAKDEWRKINCNSSTTFYVLEARTTTQRKLVREVQNRTLKKALKSHVIGFNGDTPVFACDNIHSAGAEVGTFCNIFSNPHEASCVDKKGLFRKGFIFSNMTPQVQFSTDFYKAIAELKTEFEKSAEKANALRAAALQKAAKQGVLARLFGKEKTL